MYRMTPVNQEIQDMLIADVALAIAFSILLSGAGSAPASSLQGCTLPSGIMAALCSNSFLFYLPIALVAVTFSFILHEYMHKRVAQRYGAIAAFQRSDMGILIALVTSFLGFLMALPGATMIYTNTFTKKQDGITSLAGPMTNFAVFAFFLVISLLLPASYHAGYIGAIIGTTFFISLWLAFVNMLPIYPLDGSKVLRWNKPLYALVLIIIAGLLFVFEGFAILESIAIVLVLSIVMSMFSRSALFFR